MNADDLLRRAREYLPDCSEMAKDIDEYRAAPKEEPVAIIEEDDYGCFGESLSDKSVRLGQFLYLHPPTKTAPKKAMTDFREYFEEMHSQLQEDYGNNVHIFEEGFKQGARWVQMDHSPFKWHHGIGGGDE